MTGQWFSPDTPVLSTNKTDRYDISKILLKVALNTIILTPMGWLSESKQFGQLISKLEYLHLSFTRLFLIAVNQVLHDIVSACSNVMHVNIMQFMLIKIRNIMFNATFNNIMSWRSVLLEETGVPRENHRAAYDNYYQSLSRKYIQSNLSLRSPLLSSHLY